MAAPVSRARRLEIQRTAPLIRRSHQRDGCTTPAIAAAIRAQLPEVSPLEAWRLALGWSRREAIQQITDTYRADGLLPPGLSEQMLCRWEHEQERPGAEYASRIARAYGTTPAGVGLSPATAPVAASAAARVTATTPTEEDAVRRRDMMTGALGLGLAGLTTPASAAEPGASPTGHAALERALLHTPAAAPVPPHVLRAELTAATRAYEDARYDQLAARLPALLGAAHATRDAATGRQLDLANALLAHAYAQAANVAIKQRSDLATVAGDRALTAARTSGSPRATAEAARSLAVALRHTGRTETAVALLGHTATDLDTTTDEGTALRACLLLTAAYTAAVGQHRTTALHLMDEADETTGRLPTGHALPGLATTTATPEQCALYRISVHTALGTPDEGVPHLARLDLARWPTVERRARQLTDTARMWHALGDHRRTYDTLRALDHIAPQDARRPTVRALTTHLLYSPTHLPGLREFATRTGAGH